MNWRHDRFVGCSRLLKPMSGPKLSSYHLWCRRDGCNQGTIRCRQEHSVNVRIDGIQPARRIGKMIVKRSNRLPLRFVVVSPNCMPAFTKKSSTTVNLLTASSKGECLPTSNGRQFGTSPSTPRYVAS